MIRTVAIDDAVGLTLAHDITEIRPGSFKGAAFRRGHVVRCHDLEHLRRLGKEHLFVLEPESDEVHEDEAAVQMACALCGDGVAWEGPPREGKVNLKAARDGLLKVDVEALTGFNALGEVMCATRHTNTPVTGGQLVAATRAIPLVIKRTKIDHAVHIARSAGGVLRVLPMRQVDVGVLITGNEVYYGRIEDRFAPIIRKKVEGMGGTIMDVILLPDEEERIAKAALHLTAGGAEVLITTGGMSVDPDDRTRLALERAGARDILYGSAALPGAMFLLASLEGIPVLGVPACGLYHRATIFDLIYPRVLAGDQITREDLAKLGHGGLCLHCEPCHFPVCSFGKAS
jgi:hypothetical protein